jgi:hypothetical protein
VLTFDTQANTDLAVTVTKKGRGSLLLL